MENRYQKLKTVIVGLWQVEGKEVYEKWKNREGSLVGEVYKVIDGEKIVTEYLQLVEEQSKVIYNAKVPTQNSGRTIPFTLNESVEDQYSFENLNHDFPKRIIYNFDGDNRINISVVGDEGKGFSFLYLKALVSKII